MTPQPLTDQHRLLEAAQRLARLVEPLASDPATARATALAELLQQLAHPVRQLDGATDAEQQMELFATLEIHGDGLQPFSADVAFEPGDLLVASDRSVWIVVAVDDRGHVVEVTGATSSQTKKRELVLWWRPVTTARRWLRDDEKAAPGYADLDKAMVHLVRLWGKASWEGRELRTPTGFFAEIADAPGLGLLDGALTEYSDPGEVLAFCDALGGFRPPSEAQPIAVGDVVLLREGKAWGLVTRTDREGGSQNLLVGGLRRKGRLDEPADAVKLLRDVSLEEGDRVWKPQKSDR